MMNDLEGHVIILDRLQAKGNVDNELNSIDFSNEKFAALISLPLENVTMYTLAIGSIRLPLVSTMRLSPTVEELKDAGCSSQNTLSLTAQEKSISLRISSNILFTNWHGAVREALADLVVGDLFFCNAYEPSESHICDALKVLRYLVSEDHDCFQRIRTVIQLRRELSEYLRNSSLAANTHSVNDLLSRAAASKILMSDPKYKALTKISMSRKSPLRVNNHNNGRKTETEAVDENTPANRRSGITDGRSGSDVSEMKKSRSTPSRQTQTTTVSTPVAATEVVERQADVESVAFKSVESEDEKRVEQQQQQPVHLSMDAEVPSESSCEVTTEEKVEESEVLLIESEKPFDQDTPVYEAKAITSPIKTHHTVRGRANSSSSNSISSGGVIRRGRAVTSRLSSVVMLLVIGLLSLTLLPLWNNMHTTATINSTSSAYSANSVFHSLSVYLNGPVTATAAAPEEAPPKTIVTLEEVRREYQEALKVLLQSGAESSGSTTVGTTGVLKEVPRSADDLTAGTVSSGDSSVDSGIELQIKVGRPLRLREALRQSKSRLRGRLVAAVKAVVLKVSSAVRSVVSVFVFGRDEVDVAAVLV